MVEAKYITIDGQEFTNKEEAEKYEKTLLTDAVESVLREPFELYRHSTGELVPGEAIAAVVENREDLANALLGIRKERK